jgi:DNA-binding transcriptional ArsR family regulator
MDPLTLFALANGAVKLVKEGCKLYKDIKGAAGDVHEVIKDLEDQFNNKFKDRAPTVAEKNQYIEEKNRIINLNKQAGDTTSIYAEIGQHLGVYYDNYYKCLAIFEEEERRSKYEVYHGQDSLGKRALQRVLLKKQLEAMWAELREIMVYQSPPELGALWTDVEEMMKKVGKEQAGAVAMHMKREREQAKIKARRLKRIKYKTLCWSLSITAIIYFIWLIWAIVQIRIEHQPELGRCLIPKGQWPYKHYNNLKWIDCEIRSID